MIIKCTKKLADFWKILLESNIPPVQEMDCWNSTYGNYNRKRYYLPVNELTIFGFRFMELTPKNLLIKFKEKLYHWSEYYNWLNPFDDRRLHCDQLVFCKNDDKKIIGRMNRFREDIRYYIHHSDKFDISAILTSVELLMHKSILLSMKEFPVECFKKNFINRTGHLTT